jgi:lipopolysaccharide transport system permease protein
MAVVTPARHGPTLLRIVPKGSARYLVTHGRLLLRITRNETSARFAGSLLGAAWMFIAPLLILAVYAAIYLEVFRIRVPGMSSTVYVLYVFAGLVPFLVTSESLASGVTSVVSNKSVLNNTVFPIDLVPVKAVLMGMATMMVGVVVIFVGVSATGNLHWPFLLLPILVVLHVAWLIGLTWFLSLLNVVFRDLQNIVTIVLMVLLVLSPIAYTPGQVPDNLKLLLVLNPFAYFVVAYQRVLVLGMLPSLFNVAILVVMSIATFVAASWFFARAKPVIVDYV